MTHMGFKLPGSAAQKRRLGPHEFSAFLPLGFWGLGFWGLGFRV